MRRSVAKARIAVREADETARLDRGVLTSRKHGRDPEHVRNRSRAFQAPLYIAFLLSGAAGLLYETLWARYLSLLLGHSALAQVVVLMIFLGGTAIGAVFTAELSARIQRPLLFYAAAELVLGVLGIAFPPIFRWSAHAAYGHLFPALGTGALIICAQFALGALLIFPQSVLLGATFPAMSAAIVRQDARRSGRTLATLYFTNSFGGAVGVLVGGFGLVGALGLSGSLGVAGALSIAAALVALVTAAVRRPAPALRGVEIVAPSAPTAAGSLDVPHPRVLLLGVAFGTAIASLMYEIAWTRMLTLVLGGATHSFELMLSAFIFGMSLGSLWVRRRADRFARPLRRLAYVQLAMGALAIATLPLYVWSFQLTVALMDAAQVTPAGYVLFTAGRYLVCLAVMLPATFCAGITLPLITRLLLTTGGEAAVGLVYGVNTIGSLIGVAGAAIVLLPLIGLKALMIVAAAVDMALGIWILAAERKGGEQHRAVLAFAVATLACVFATVGVEFNRELLTSGIFRSRRLPPPGTHEILFYRDGRTATVSATLARPATIQLATNGKVDASLGDAWTRPAPSGGKPQPFSGDASTQAFLALLALAHQPAARAAAVIGQGSGMTSHLLLGSDHLTSLTTLEIEPEMIAGSNVFYPANRRVFDDPRSRFVVEDARSFLAAAHDRYDLIVSEPSNPWVSGVASLFTTESYDIVSRRLAPHGVFVQWIQLYETNDDLLLSVLAAIHANFRSYTLYQVSLADVAVVASNDSSLPAPDWSILRWSSVAADLHNFLPLTPQSLDALWLADRDALAPLIDGGIVANSDEYPTLDLGAERERYLGHTADGFTRLGTLRFDPLAALRGHRFPLATEAQTTVPEIARPAAAALSARLRGGLDAPRDGLPAGREYPAMLLRKRMLDAFVARGVAPPDWQVWMRNVAIVESNVHGGAAGAVDESFYEPLYRFMRATKAPTRAVAALDFMHGLASWNFRQAATAADLLLAGAEGEGWVPHDMLRDGAVVARLATGNLAGARRAFDLLTPGVDSPRDLRSQALDAIISAYERRRQRR